MNTRLNQVLLGVIIFLVGFYCLFQRSLDLDLSSMFMIFLGFAFALLYRTKKKSWSLLLGAFLMYFGVNDIIGAAFANRGLVEVLVDSIMSSLFFVTPGVVLLLLFQDKNKNGLLIPGSFLVAMGLNSIVKSVLPVFSYFSSYLVFGLCFYYIYSTGKYFLGKWPLYLSGILFFIGATRILAHLF